MFVHTFHIEKKKNTSTSLFGHLQRIVGRSMGVYIVHIAAESPSLIHCGLCLPSPFKNRCLGYDLWEGLVPHTLSNSFGGERLAETVPGSYVSRKACAVFHILWWKLY